MRQCSCDEESDAQRNKITWQNIFLDLVPDSAGHSPFSMDNHLSFLWFSPPLLSHPPPHLPSAHSSPVPLSSALRLFLVIPRSVWGLRFPPRDWSRSPGSHGVLSMHHKGIPSTCLFQGVLDTEKLTYSHASQYHLSAHYCPFSNPGRLSQLPSIPSLLPANFSSLGLLSQVSTCISNMSHRRPSAAVQQETRESSLTSFFFLSSPLPPLSRNGRVWDVAVYFVQPGNIRNSHFFPEILPEVPKGMLFRPLQIFLFLATSWLKGKCERTRSLAGTRCLHAHILLTSWHVLQPQN